VVDLTPELVAMLHRHLAWVKSEGLRQGRGEREWLFPNEEGNPMDESRVRKAFKRALKAATLPEFRLYDLRHTYASLLLAANAPITYVSAQPTPTPPPRSATTPGGFPAKDDGGRTSWIG
jgi:integrase